MPISVETMGVGGCDFKKQRQPVDIIATAPKAVRFRRGHLDHERSVNATNRQYHSKSEHIPKDGTYRRVVETAKRQDEATNTVAAKTTTTQAD